MNILYIGAFRLPNLDAAAPRVLNNAKVLRKLGHSVNLISWGGRYRNEDLCPDGKYRIDGFEYYISGDLPLGDSIKERLLTKIFRGNKAIKILESIIKPDLIITYNADYSFSRKMIRYCKNNNIKLANDINEWYANCELHLLDILRNHINMTRIQHKIRNKIVISSFLNNYYKDSNNVLIPPLCDPEEAKWTTEINDERIKPYDGITLIYAGTPGKKDIIHSVINAVNTLAGEGYAIRFIILGISRDSYMMMYSKFLNTQQLHENIIFLGRVSQDLIPAYYKMADFMILVRKPNRKNMAGFPTKFAESMIADVPVITNATSDMNNYVKDGKNGFIVNGYDYDSIIYTLKNFVLRLHKDDIREMKNCVHSFNSDFDWHSHVSDFRKFIQNLK